MESQKFFKIAIGVLVLLNLSLLFKDFYSIRIESVDDSKMVKTPPHSRLNKNLLADKVSTDLGLDEGQDLVYQEYRQMHMEAMRSINERHSKLLNEYFKLLKNENTPIQDQSKLLTEIQLLEKERIDVTYEHFASIKKLCDEDQIKKFPQVLDHAVDAMLNKRHGPSRHHRRH